MPSKPLKVNFPIRAESAEEAIASLSGQFLRMGRGGCKIVSKQTAFSVAELCKALIDDWESGKVTFANGEITLSFTSGKLARESDLLIYTPEQGDRFLYTGQSIASSPQQVSTEEITSNAATKAASSDGATDLTQPLQTVADVLAELAANQRAVESRLQTLQSPKEPSDSALKLSLADVQTVIHEALDAQTTSLAKQLQATLDAKAASLADIQTVIYEALDAQAASLAKQLQAALDAQAASITKQLQAALDAQAGTFAQLLSSQITSTVLHFNKRLDAMQAQLDQLTTELKELEALTEPAPLPIPQSEAEWLDRIKTTWGTVGDYEQYSFSHRTVNAETPLFYTPDWVALCELDWVRKLHPTLAFLYELIHGESGIGYGGADILQQFGCHLDPHTNEPYYIYHLGGFTAYEALWQTVYNPQYSWLPELQHLCARISNRHQDIFELFGWEQEAVTSLESVVKRATYEQQSERQSAYDTYNQPSQTSENIISHYLALLNIGPFTPITPESIKRAYKRAMKTAHPDTGGSKEMAQKVNEAYEVVLKHYFPQTQ